MRFNVRLVTKAMLEKRRNSPTKRLTSEQSERLARLAKVYNFALDIYRAPEKSRVFLKRSSHA